MTDSLIVTTNAVAVAVILCVVIMGGVEMADDTGRERHAIAVMKMVVMATAKAVPCYAETYRSQSQNNNHC